MTSSNLSNNYQFAGFSKRLSAFAFDYLVILAYIAFLTVISISLIWASNLFQRIVIWLENPIIFDLIVFLILVLPVILYFTFQESSSHQASWGKRKIGLRVINTNGDRLTSKQAFLRSFLKFLPWQIAHTSIFHIEGWPLEPAEPTSMVIAGFILVWVLVGLYLVSMLVSKNHRTPYDWASGAYVIMINWTMHPNKTSTLPDGR